MLSKLILAVVVGVVVYLICVFVGSILVALGVPIADTVGGFLQQFAVVIGFLAAIWYFFAVVGQFDRDRSSMG